MLEHFFVKKKSHCQSNCYCVISINAFTNSGDLRMYQYVWPIYWHEWHNYHYRNQCLFHPRQWPRLQWKHLSTARLGSRYHLPYWTPWRCLIIHLPCHYHCRCRYQLQRRRRWCRRFPILCRCQWWFLLPWVRCLNQAPRTPCPRLLHLLELAPWGEGCRTSATSRSQQVSLIKKQFHPPPPRGFFFKKKISPPPPPPPTHSPCFMFLEIFHSFLTLFVHWTNSYCILHIGTNN